MSNYQGFEDRHIGPSAAQESEMLSVLGYSTMQSFISDVLPSNIAIAQKLDEVLDTAKSETEVIAELRALASENQVFNSFIGTGYYGTITPPVVKRNVLENPAWYTAYTPVSTRDFTRSIRSSLCFPDSHLRYDRSSVI